MSMMPTNFKIDTRKIITFEGYLVLVHTKSVLSPMKKAFVNVMIIPVSEFLNK